MSPPSLSNTVQNCLEAGNRLWREMSHHRFTNVDLDSLVESYVLIPKGAEKC